MQLKSPRSAYLIPHYARHARNYAGVTLTGPNLRTAAFAGLIGFYITRILPRVTAIFGALEGLLDIFS